MKKCVSLQIGWIIGHPVPRNSAIDYAVSRFTWHLRDGWRVKSYFGDTMVPRLGRIIRAIRGAA